MLFAPFVIKKLRAFKGGENMKTWLALAIAVILISFGTVACAVEDKAEPSNQEHGLVIKNWKGEYIGTSNHVVQDFPSGNIIFIIVSLNPEKKEIAVPVDLFSADQQNGTLVLNISKKELDSVPEFYESDLKDPEFVEKVYRFFATGSPRTEETSL